MTARIRCDASHELGLGHVVRCRALGEALRDLGIEVVFAMSEGGGFVPDFPVEGRDLLPADILVVDVPGGITSEDLRHHPGLTVVIDSGSPHRLGADLVFFPPAPQVAHLTWPGFRGEILTGWEWVLLRREFAAIAVKNEGERGPGTPERGPGAEPQGPEAPKRGPGAQKMGPKAHPNLLVTMGGSDPHGLTRQVFAALAVKSEEMPNVTVLLGPGYRGWGDLDGEGSQEAAPAAKSARVLRGTDDMPGLMQQADLAICSFGMTAYELAAAGTPAIYLCISDDHAASAQAFEDAGIGINLGHFQRVNPEQIRRAVKQMAEADLAGMGRRAQQLVDGKGADRIARKILRSWNESRRLR